MKTFVRVLQRISIVVIGLFFLELAVSIISLSFKYDDGFGFHLSFWQWMKVWNVIMVIEFIVMGLVSYFKPEWLEEAKSGG